MYRREFITLVGGAAVAWPLAARAQQTGSVPRVGVLYPGPMGSAPPRVGAIVEGLRAAGFAQVEVVLRVTEGDSSRIALMVTDIIASKVDVFMAISAAVIRAAQSATQTIPIVGNDLESDPVDTGWAASLSHPGGNITGVFLAFPDFAAKWLELLRDTLPRLTRVTILWDPSTGIFQKQAIESAAKVSGVALRTIELHTPSDFDGAFDLAKREGVDALIILSSPLIGANVRKAAELATLHHLPAITLFPDFARAGGLIAYGPNLLGLYRDSGSMIAKVLQGRKPADLPIQRPTKFDLVVNLKTAKALGVTPSNALIALADEVIE